MKKLIIGFLVFLLSFSSTFALSVQDSNRIKLIELQISRMEKRIQELQIRKAAILNGESVGTVNGSNVDRSWMEEYGVSEESYRGMASGVCKKMGEVVQTMSDEECNRNVKAYFLKNSSIRDPIAY